MDPYIKLWMYFSWIQDRDEKIEFAREHGILIGSFIDPAAAKAIAKADNPSFSMTDEEFEKQTEELFKDDPAPVDKEDKKSRRHRHKKLAKRDE